MNLITALDIKQNTSVAFVGGGGKTTTMWRLAAELAAANRQVLVTTTTKIYLPPRATCPTVFWTGQKSCINFNDATNILAVGAGLLPQNKLQGLAPQVVDELITTGLADHVLVEADGSRGLALKTPADQEPVLPSNIDVVVIVMGLDILDQKLTEDAVHRPGLVAQQAATELGQIIDENIVAQVLTHPLGFMSRIPGTAQAVFLLNKTDQVPRGRVLNLMELLQRRGATKVVAGAMMLQDTEILVSRP